MTTEGRPLLGLDLDNTVADFAGRAIEVWHHTGLPSASRAQWTEWSIEKSFGRPALRELHKAARYPAFWEQMLPIAGVVRELVRLIPRYQLVIITVRPPALETITRSWLALHEIPYDDLILTGSLEVKLKTTHELNCVGMVDDSQEVVEALQGHGLVVGQLALPWNQGGPGIVRSTTWAGLALGMDHQLQLRAKGKK